MIGRKEERIELERALLSTESDLIAVYGRRRVGKTYLIREYFKQHTIFSYSGLLDGTLEEHLDQFSEAIQESFNLPATPKTPETWFDAFKMLKQSVAGLKSRKKKVIFLDEMPWMATPKSRFLVAFESFWNSWASAKNDLIVVICGSATSWMIENIEKNKGGLYNRVTKRIHLEPFTLKETADFLKSKNISFSRYHILQTYMMFGGIPHYLNQIDTHESPDVVLKRVLLSKKGSLHREFDQLFESLFGKSNNHQIIIETLVNHRYGLTRANLLTKIKMSSGGWFTKTIEELSSSGFIETYVPYGKKSKDAKIKVIDNFCLFYIHFIKNKKIKNWDAVLKSRSWSSWSGSAFENICQYHSKQIINALGLAAIYTETTSWHHRGSDEMSGAQIDLLIDRADNAFNICEIKYNLEPFTITKKYAQELRLKKAAFRHHSKTKKTLFTTMIAAGGLVKNEYSLELINSTIDVEDMFL